MQQFSHQREPLDGVSDPHSASAEPELSALDRTWPLTGRDTDRDRVLTALRREAPAVFVYGASGVGKTRFAHAIGEALQDEGWFRLQASGNPALSAIPFATFAPAIARGPGQPPLPTATDPVTLFTMGNAVITDLAGDRRVVLVLDDVSRADTVSLALISQLVIAGRLCVVATVAEGEPLPDAVLPVASAAGAGRIDLEPLTIEGTTELLGAALGAPIAHRDAVTLHHASRGNPLFLRELTIGAHHAGALTEVDGVWQLRRAPAGTPALRDLISTRLRALTSEERDVLDRLALCQTLAMSEFSRPEAVTALANLEARNMISIDESGHGIAISLAHPHYSAVIREAMPRIRAISLLVEQADIVERHGMNPADELRVANWRLDAGQRADPALLERTARLAQQAHDLRAAARLATAALDAEDPALSTILLHADIMWAQGRGVDALSSLERAERVARSAGAPAQVLAQIAAKRAEVYGGDPLGSVRGIALLDEIEAELPEQRPMLLLSKAALELHTLNAKAAVACVEEASGYLASHPAGAAISALASAMPLSYMHRHDEALAAAELAVEHAAGAEPVFTMLRAQMVRASVLIDADRYVEARAAVVDSLHDAIREDDQFAIRMNELNMGRIFWMSGRLDAATRWLRDAVTGAELHGPGAVRSPALGLLAVIACEQGDLDAARGYRARMDEGYDRDDSLTALAEGWILRTSGDLDGAAAVFRESAARAVPLGAYGVASSFLQHLARLGSREYARQAAEMLEQLSEIDPSPHVRMRLRHARAEAEADAPALRELGAEWESLGIMLYAAEAFASAGQAAAAEGRGREAAADRQRSAALLAACEGASTPLLQFSDGAEPLTPREREIASLAAQGLSSNEIASRLFLSPRTVNNHLQASYTKLGIRGRHELRV